jgi:hypothetical protein
MIQYRGKARLVIYKMGWLLLTRLAFACIKILASYSSRISTAGRARHARVQLMMQNYIQYILVASCSIRYAGLLLEKISLISAEKDVWGPY